MSVLFAWRERFSSRRHERRRRHESEEEQADERRQYLWCSPDPRYLAWIQRAEPSPLTASRERQDFAVPPFRDDFTLHVDVPKGSSTKDLAWTLRSIFRQTYPHWRVQAWSGTGRPRWAIARCFRGWAQYDQRCLEVSQEDRHADLRHSHVLAGRSGRFVLMIEAGDRLAPRALEYFAREIGTDPAMLYADEDRATPAGRRQDPIFKPGWMPERLLSGNYIGRPVCVNRSWLLAAPDFPFETIAAFHDETALRLAETNAAVRHIPECLCHRPLRTAAPAAAEGETARYRRCLAQALARRSAARADQIHFVDGIPAWPLPEPPPTVSIVMPRTGSIGELAAAVQSLFEHTPPAELIIVEPTARIEEVQRRVDALVPAGWTVHILAQTEASDWVRACRAGANVARGDHLLFLDARAKVSADGWLAALLRPLCLPGVEAVGPLLVTPEQTVHSAGLVPGIALLAGHLCRQEALDGPGAGDCALFGNPAAISGRALLVRRRRYEELGGFDAGFSTSLYDVDFCLRLRRAGGRVVMTPAAHIQLREIAADFSHEDARRMIERMGEPAAFVDPAWHPRWDPQCETPRLRSPDALDAANHMRLIIEAIETGTRPAPPLDVCDDAALTAFLGAEGLELPAPPMDPAAAARDEQGAAAFCLALLRGDPALRRRFPRALRGGAEGAFCGWLCSEGRLPWNLSENAVSNIRAVFASRPSHAVRYQFGWRWDLRWFFPLGLLPGGRRPLLRWLLTQGRSLNLRPEEIWWFLLETGEDPAAELSLTWRLQPEWQRKHPQALATADSAARFVAWMQRVYRFDPQEIGWPPPAPHASGEDAPTTPSPDMPGVNILSHWCLPCGLQHSAEVTGRALEAVGVPVARRDVPASEHPEPPLRERFLDPEVYDCTMVFLAPFFPPETRYAMAATWMRPDVYRIGFWHWEFQELPESWRHYALSVDEVWAPTRFLESAFRRSLPAELPVVFMPVGHEVTPAAGLSRRDFGLDPETFTFLTMLDMGSSVARKNPEGVIRAFRLAFAPDEPVALVIKVSRGSQHQAEFARLQAQADAAGVRVIDRVMPRGEALALIEQCDAYVSLHRAEGLGLPLAEAMLLGRPVVGTAYSGNLDFMTPENSRLVRSSPATVPEDWFPYRRGWIWAEPDIDDAAAHLRWIVDHREEAALMAARGRRDAAAAFDMAAFGRRMRARLEVIRRGRICYSFPT